MPTVPLPFYYYDDYDDEQLEERINDTRKDKVLEGLLSPFDNELIKKARKDKNIRKQILIDSLILENINGIEKCVADTSRISSDEVKNTHRERWYYGGNPDNGCFARDVGLREYIYYSSTIPYIYHLKHLEYIDAYREETILSFLALIYPAKMPTKDYFPFIEFDIGTKIPLLLTEEEKQRYGGDEEVSSNPNIYEYKIDAGDWCFCIIWLDKHRMFVNLFDDAYYFKQVGKNVHLFRLVFPM